MTPPRVALVVGTRPEAIKMAPVHRALTREAAVRPWVVSSGQHKELLAGALAAVEMPADVDLGLMTPGQGLNPLLARVVERMGALFEAERPAAVLLQGDTTTALGAALAAYHLRIPVGHVEAGLRTHDHAHPFPEEGNRQLIDRLSRWCFAPTDRERENLAAERIDAGAIHVTGNTAVDAILWVSARSTFTVPAETLLLTLHRRESFGGELDAILEGLADFLGAQPDARVLWPMHPNPHVDAARVRALGEHPRVEVIAPLAYTDFAGALRSCRFVLTDSGGIQEEAPTFGKTVLVARETTERPTHAPGSRNRLIGRTRAAVTTALREAWTEAPYAGALPAPNPFGDGNAGARIARTLVDALAG